MRPRIVLWLIIVLTVLVAWVNVPPLERIGNVVLPSAVRFISDRFPIKLGLDLEGGAELVLRARMDEVDPSDRDTALESARQVIEKRVNPAGVSETVVQSSKLGEERRILVELPGVKDLSVVTQLIQQTAQLEFRELSATGSVEATTSAILSLDTTQETGLTGKDLKKAQVTFGSGSGGRSGPQISIEFTSEGAEKFAAITKRNIGRPLCIFLDDSLIDDGCPTVEQEIIGGSAVITGNFTPEQAKQLSTQLNAGALPVPMEVLQQRLIGATLGQESIQRSLAAGIIGITLVMLYMVAYYGFYGLIADLALIIYTLIVLAVFRTGLFIMPPVTLTLAGIAGFILSIGMAVDANILTFERMKEEFRSGKSGKAALESGFARAWTSIRDSNVSSMITAGILLIFGTSVVRGFAVTLLIGVLVSMFSAIIITRTFLRLLPRFRSKF